MNKIVYYIEPSMSLEVSSVSEEETRALIKSMEKNDSKGIVFISGKDTNKQQILPKRAIKLIEITKVEDGKKRT